MTSRLLAAVVVFCLSASPALGAFCGLGCARAEEGAPVAQGRAASPGGVHAHVHDPSSPHPDASEEPSDPGDLSGEPHDCHRPAAGDVDTIGSIPVSCTHLRFETEPAKLVPGSEVPVTVRVATCEGLVLELGPDPQRAAREQLAGPSISGAWSPAFILPLRI